MGGIAFIWEDDEPYRGFWSREASKQKKGKASNFVGRRRDQ